MISSLSILNVPNNKEILERVGKPKDNEGMHWSDRAQPEVVEGAQGVELDKPNTISYKPLNSPEDYMLVISTLESWV